jgi:hypothetical protein
MTTTEPTYTWTVPAGSLDGITFAILDAAGPRPVPGWTVDAKIKDRPGGTVLHTFPSTMAVLSGDGTTVTLTIPGDVSAAWTFVNAWFRVKVINPAALVPVEQRRVLSGPIVVLPE